MGLTIDLTPDELAYLIKALGGKLDMSTKVLGSGLTAQGVLALRAKLEAMQ